MKTSLLANVHVGCAGWSIPRAHAERFAVEGSHLARYAGQFPAVEINSSFYRPHRPTTYARWAASVPSAFRFAVKLPQEITHVRRLSDAAELLQKFLAEVGSLGAKLGPLLVQLPPSLAFNGGIAQEFLAALRARFDGGVAFEPRHASWFGSTATRLLTQFEVARVAADPAVVPAAAAPGGWNGFSYYRLHGAPRTYYSAYSADFLDALATRLAAEATAAPTWVIFDNTALGSATVDALGVLERLRA